MKVETPYDRFDSALLHGMTAAGHTVMGVRSGGRINHRFRKPDHHPYMHKVLLAMNPFLTTRFP